MNIRKLSLSLIKLNNPLPKGLFFLIIISISNYCYSGIYKWVDEQGNVHYGQQRPASVQSEQMRVQNYAPQDTSSYKRPGLNTDNENNKSTSSEAEKEEKKPESKAEKKQRLAACAQARKNLTRMQSIGRIKSKDKDGNSSFISQKQKEEKMQQSRDLISKHCK